MRFIPAWLMRSMAPIHSSRSGFTGFFTSTGMSIPFKLSAKACIAKGFADVRAPIHSTSMPYFRASSTCSGVATSVAVIMPVSSLTRCIQGRAFSPLPSNPPGLVRGFHTPARNMWQPLDASCLAVSITCSSVSAEHGPAITVSRLLSLGKLSGCSSSSIILLFCFIQSFDISLMRFKASSIFSSLAQSDIRTYLSPLLPKINPGVMNTLARCNTFSVSSSAVA